MRGISRTEDSSQIARLLDAFQHNDQGMFTQLQIVEIQCPLANLGNHTLRRATISNLLVDGLRNGKRTDVIGYDGSEFGAVEDSINLVAGINAML